MDEIVDMAKIIEEQENDKNAYHSRSFQRTNSAPTLNGQQRHYNNNNSARSGEVSPVRKSVDSPRDNKQSDQKKTGSRATGSFASVHGGNHVCKTHVVIVVKGSSQDIAVKPFRGLNVWMWRKKVSPKRMRRKKLKVKWAK